MPYVEQSTPPDLVAAGRLPYQALDPSGAVIAEFLSADDLSLFVQAKQTQTAP